jgi:Spy/CpxP family protein refolding chaperone
VRDVNRRFAKVIEGQLTGDAKSAFAAEVQKRSYPDVFRQQRAQRSLDAAIGFGDLTSDQRTAIEALRSSYGRDLDAINVEHMAAVDKSEAEFSAERMMNWGGDPNDPMRAIRTKKRELNNKVVESLKSILTPEQAQRLPQGGDEEPGRRMRAPGGDNGGGGEAPRRRPRGGGGGGGGGE